MELLMNKATDLQVKARCRSKGISMVLLGEKGMGKRQVSERIAASDLGVEPGQLQYCHRVIIIDECHRISSSAWDALLKTLEEPPEHVMLILCMTDETALPETIRSRAPIYRFESISAGMLSRHAKETAEKQGIKISDNALNLLASYADGSMRNVLSLLEQMSMQSKDITEDDVEIAFLQRTSCGQPLTWCCKRQG